MTFVTLKPALVVIFGIPDLLTVHRPLAFVVHVPTVPSFQRPVTEALASTVWLLSWTVMVTVEVQRLFWLVAAPSRSPTCIGNGVTMSVCGTVVVAPMSSVTNSLTWYAPTAAYVWLAMVPAPVVPSPKSQA